MTNHQKLLLFALLAFSFQACLNNSGKMSSAKIKRLIKYLESNKEEEAQSALKVLAGSKSIPDEIIAPLIKAAKINNLKFAENTGHLLAGHSSAQNAALPGLIKDLADPEQSVRLNLVAVLGQMADENNRIEDRPLIEKICSALDPSLTDADPSVRLETVRALKKSKIPVYENNAYIGAYQNLVLSPLLESFSGSDPEIRLEIMDIFIKSPFPAVRPYFLKAMKDPDPRLRAKAAEILRVMPGMDSGMIPLIIPLLGDSDGKVVQMAESFFTIEASYNPRHTNPALLKALKSSNTRVRRGACEVFGFLGAQGDPAVLSIVPLLRDQNPALAQAAQNSLAKIGTPNALRALKEHRPN